MNPSYQYTTAGTYTVCLKMKVFNSNNIVSCEDSICKTVVIQGVTPRCDAAFTAHPVANLRVEFTNNSVSANPNSTTYHWTYGDGTDSSGFAPDHIYTAAGTYTVCLYMYDQSTNCRDTLCKTVVVGQSTPTCTAYFTYNIATLASPFVVYFTDASVTSTPNDPVVAWHWDFGDNTIDSAENPIHTFTTPGQYVVCLTITTLSGCTNTVCKPLNLGNNTTCAANFTYVVSGFNVAFTNTSNQGGVTASYVWTFGDNTSSTAQNPTHTYAVAGQYRVCLKITTSNGCVSDICKWVTVGINTINCEAAFIAYPVANNRVEFTNNSVSANPNATSYKWTYGDGTASTQFAPDHIYQAPGTYTVCLYIYDQQANCRDTICKPVVVGTSTVPVCNAAFSYTVSGSQVQFTSTSVPALNTTSHYWSFGDGTTSTQVNPQHIFANPGTYTVCLTIINSLNGCTDDVCHTIVIGTSQTQFCISGKICKGINSNPAYPAYVYLIYYDSIQGTLTAVRTTGTNQNGEYEFCNVPQGKYLVKVALSPNAPDYRNYLPTYYGNSLFWSYGIQVVLNQNRQQVDICLIAGNNNGGPGFVGGYVQQGANKTGNFTGDALVGVQVMLLDLNDNPLQYTFSDEDGRFTFDDVAYGTYKVYAEVLDKATIPYLVTIGAEQIEKDNILLLVETAQVISGLDEQLNTTIRSLRIYPNPVTDVVYVELNLTTGSDVHIAVTDITGKVIVEEILNGNSGEQLKRISMASQQAGIYFVRIVQGDLNKTIKIMKY
jgi:PKD repeat protein